MLKDVFSCKLYLQEILHIKQNLASYYFIQPQAIAGLLQYKGFNDNTLIAEVVIHTNLF